MENKHVVLWFFICFLYLTSARRNYNGGIVLRVETNDEELYDEILKRFDSSLDKWSATDVFVNDDATLAELSEKLQEHGFTYRIVVDDVDRLLRNVETMNQEHEQRTRLRRSVHGNSLVPDVVGRYATYQEIMDWLWKQAEINNDIMELHTIGKTYEKRELIVVKLGTNSSLTKPAIWMDFGIHAREWISPATGTYIIDKLLEGWQTDDSDITNLLEAVDFYFLPVTNPDGYAYTHEKERLWRKNRGPDYNNTGCIGTDLNRNFGYHWGGACSSGNQCSILFRGPTPESELETKAIEKTVKVLSSSLMVFLTVHSYSQLWMTGWSYTEERSDIHDQEIALATKAVSAIFNTTKTVYRAGPSPTLLYKYSGGSPDWAKGVAGIKYSFCVELRDRGEYGFLLPAEQILDTGAEMFAAVRAMAEHITEEAAVNPRFYQPIEEGRVDLGNIEIN